MSDDRYRITGDVVRDTTTGLEWQREHSGPMTWDEAVKYAARRGSGWRLPMVEELIVLLDFTHYEPASEFPPSPGGYWSSSSYAGSASSAWCVPFNCGPVNYVGKAYALYVRCVRRRADARSEQTISSYHTTLAATRKHDDDETAQ